MADNTLLNAGTGGDTIRDVAKTANTPAKTQMVILDVGGGADASPETALVLGQAVKASSLPVTIASDQPAVPVSGTFWQTTQPISGSVTVSNASIPVTGTFWQATQPVSAASLPLPAGAATSADQVNVQSAPGTAQTTAVTIQGNASGIAVPVSGTFWQATQPVSAASLPLPAGASTAANQTAVQSVPGTAQTAAVTVQGNASGIPLPVMTESLALASTANSATGTLTAGTAANILPVNAGRHKVIVANNGSAVMYLSWIGTASATAGFQLAAGATYIEDHPFSTALSAYCASANAYTVMEG